MRTLNNKRYFPPFVEYQEHSPHYSSRWLNNEYRKRIEYLLLFQLVKLLLMVQGAKALQAQMFFFFGYGNCCAIGASYWHDWSSCISNDWPWAVGRKSTQKLHFYYCC